MVPDAEKQADAARPGHAHKPLVDVRQDDAAAQGEISQTPGVMVTTLPGTRQEWQDLVNAAEFLLLVDSARQYGLVTGGPEADVERCILILEEGRRRGVTPRI